MEERILLRFWSSGVQPINRLHWTMGTTFIIQTKTPNKPTVARRSSFRKAFGRSFSDTGFADFLSISSQFRNNAVILWSNVWTFLAYQRLKLSTLKCTKNLADTMNWTSGTGVRDTWINDLISKRWSRSKPSQQFGIVSYNTKWTLCVELNRCHK